MQIVLSTSSIGIVTGITIGEILENIIFKITWKLKF